MIHVLPADEADQHETHPDHRCPCRVQLALVDIDGRLAWRFTHRPLTR